MVIFMKNKNLDQIFQNTVDEETIKLFS